jgi:homeobox protein ESX1
MWGTMTDTGKTDPKPAPAPKPPAKAEPPPRPKEIGGPSGPEPTRFGDWERKGRVSDF